MKNQILKQALTISGSRLIALTMATTDLMVLGRYSVEEVSDFTLSSQYIQIFIILAVVLNIGINIFYNGCKYDNKHAVGNTFGYTFIYGTLLFIISMGLYPILELSANQQTSYIVLATGILPTTFYIASCNLLEAENKASIVFKVSIGWAIMNIALDLAFVVANFSSQSIAVALSTTVVRCLSMIVGMYLVKKYLRTSPLPRFSLNDCKTLFNFGKTEAITSILFTGGIALLCYAIANMTSTDQFARLGIALNFMNCTSILYTGMTIAISIYISRNMDILPINIKYFIKFASSYILVCSGIFILSRPIISWLYLGKIDPMLVNLFLFAIGIIAFDGMAMLLISLLRLMDHKTIPPLFRLALVVIGIPLSMMLFDGNDLSVIMICLMLGNFIAMCLAGFYLYLSKSSMMKYQANSIR